MNAEQKKRLLGRTLQLMGLLLLLALLLVLFADSFERREGDDIVAVAIGEIPAGGTRSVQWQGLPVLVINLQSTPVRRLPANSEQLRDPQSRWSRQPTAFRNAWRAPNEFLLVVIALGTEMGCPVRPQFSDGVLYGFADRCRGWRYDAAGRVYKHQAALQNLAIPPYRIVGDTVYIGVAPR